MKLNIGNLSFSLLEKKDTTLYNLFFRNTKWKQKTKYIGLLSFFTPKFSFSRKKLKLIQKWGKVDQHVAAWQFSIQGSFLSSTMRTELQFQHLIQSKLL